LIQIRFEAQRCETILGVLGLLWSAAITAEMEYRANFVRATLTSLGNLAGSCLGYFCSTTLATPSRVVVVGSPCGAGHLYRAARLFQYLPRPQLNSIVKRPAGTLDFVLLKPISSQFWLSSHTLSPWGLPVWSLEVLIGYAGRV